MAEDYSSKIWKILFLILAVGFGLRYWLTLDAGTYKGKGFSIVFPLGWTEWKIPEAVQKENKEGLKNINTVTYVSPTQDPASDTPAASLSIISYKLQQAAWLDDEFPRIVTAIQKKGGRVIKKGEITLNNEPTRWVFYEDVADRILNLEFYIITNENMFYKIHYAAKEAAFNKYRPAFEKAKATFKITGFRL